MLWKRTISNTNIWKHVCVIPSNGLKPHVKSEQCSIVDSNCFPLCSSHAETSSRILWDCHNVNQDWSSLTVEFQRQMVGFYARNLPNWIIYNKNADIQVHKQGNFGADWLAVFFFLNPILILLFFKYIIFILVF